MTTATEEKHTFTPSIDANKPQPDIGQARFASDRYTSIDYMAREWPQIWRRVWNQGPRLAEFKAPGDYVLHSLGKESFIFVLDQHENVRCFYNVCQHRGNRLVEGSPCGKAKFFKCQFHAWSWNIDGSIKGVADADTFPQFRDGLPKEELGLTEVRVDQWGGWIWFNLDGEAAPLLEYLGEVPSHLANYDIDRMQIFEYKTFLWDCNWKTACDAFNESYHFRGLHPQMLKWSNDIARIELLGLHSRMINEYGTVSKPYRQAQELFPELKQWLTSYQMDPDAYQGKPSETRLEKQRYSRSIQDEVPFLPYKKLTDEQLSDVYHYFIFPNIVFNVYAEGFNCFRYRPHETDPNKMYYDLILFAQLPPGEEPSFTHELFTDKVAYDSVLEVPQPEIITEVLQQDADNVSLVQAGLHSEGFKGVLFGDQEIRLRHFHNMVDEYMK